MNKQSQTPETEAAIYTARFGPMAHTAVHPDFARKLELQRDEARRKLSEAHASMAALRSEHEVKAESLNRQMALAVGGYIDASEIARLAMRAMRHALAKGMSHSRKDLENSVSSLSKRLEDCSLVRDELELVAKDELIASRHEALEFKAQVLVLRAALSPLVALGSTDAKQALSQPAPPVVSKARHDELVAHADRLALAIREGGIPAAENCRLNATYHLRIMREAIAAHEARKEKV